MMTSLEIVKKSFTQKCNRIGNEQRLCILTNFINLSNSLLYIIIIFLIID